MKDFSDNDDELHKETRPEPVLGSDISDGWGTDDGSIHEADDNPVPDGSVYETRSPRSDGKTDHFFNESGRMTDPHGHVVEGHDSTPEQTTYDYVRDADGNVYIDRRDDS
jgi:hypothetical protein